MAQLVVISGKKMPSARDSAGLTFFTNISTSWTVAAMTATKDSSRRYGASRATMSCWMPNAHVELTTITKVTAAPIRDAVFSLPETPRKGQIPRK